MKIDLLKKFYSSRQNKAIEYIVIHYTGTIGADGNAELISKSLHNLENRPNVQPNKKRSTHYIVGDAGIIQVVKDKYAAWHVGKYKREYKIKCENSNSIGIDLVEHKIDKTTHDAHDKDWYFTENTINQAAALVAFLMKTYQIDIKHVVRHYDVTGKWCPAPFIGWTLNKYNSEYNENSWADFKHRILCALKSITE